ITHTKSGRPTIFMRQCDKGPRTPNNIMTGLERAKFYRIRCACQTISRAGRGARMSRAVCKIIVTCTSVGLFAATTWAQDRSETAALQLIRETAADICTTAPMEAADSRVELSGSAKAKLDGAISKVVNLGLEGAAKYQAE